MKPTVKALFQTRCGCRREFYIPYPAPPKYYLPLKSDFSEMWPQHDLPQKPISDVRVFVLTHYGHVQESGEGVIHVVYSENMDSNI